MKKRMIGAIALLGTASAAEGQMIAFRSTGAMIR